MIRIAITAAAFEAIAATLPLGSVGYENATNERGERLIWLERSVIDRLRSLRGPGRSFSDVILRMAIRNRLRSKSSACRQSRMTPKLPLARDRLIPDTLDFSVPASRACP